MGLEVCQTSGNLESYVEKIKSRIKNIAHDFYCIGYYLWEVKHFNYYLESGYKDIYDFSEKELNFKQSSTKNFISLVDKYAERGEGSNYPKMWIAEKYKAFGYSQLTEMLSLSPNQIESINSDMTIKQIREKKKELKSKESNIIDVEFKQDQVDLVENQIVIFNDSIPNEVEKFEINYNVLLKETDILRFNFKTINEDHTKLMHENEKLKKDNEKLKKENLKLKKSNLDPKQIDSEKSIISDILKVLNLEWSKIESDDYAEGLNRAIRLINQKFESNS